MKPYYEDELCSVYWGDARSIAPQLGFDVVVTDPPYGIAYRQTLAGAPDHGPIVGDESPALAEWLITTFASKPMLVFGANHFPHILPTPGRWACWDKRVSENADRMLGSPFELAWCNGPHKAGRMYRVQHGGVVNADGANVKRVHPTQKPVVLLRRMIDDLVPAGVVLDPFMGSGSTLRAAKDLGRKAIGIEVEERYCEAAAQRLAQEVLAL